MFCDANVLSEVEVQHGFCERSSVCLDYICLNAAYARSFTWLQKLGTESLMKEKPVEAAERARCAGRGHCPLPSTPCCLSPRARAIFG